MDPPNSKQTVHNYEMPGLLGHPPPYTHTLETGEQMSSGSLVETE